VSRLWREISKIMINYHIRTTALSLSLSLSLGLGIRHEELSTQQRSLLHLRKIAEFLAFSHEKHYTVKMPIRDRSVYLYR